MNKKYYINMPCMCSTDKSDWRLRYYAGKTTQHNVCVNGKLSDTNKLTMTYRYIIPFKNFNPDDINISLTFNIQQ